MLLAIATMGSLFLFVGNLTGPQLKAQRQARTEWALREAREALVGYAVRYRDLQRAQDDDSSGDDDKSPYGFLPMPDLGSSRNNNAACLTEGCAANTPGPTGTVMPDSNGILPTLVGRFPWKSVGSGPLLDGHGECLWLVVSSLHLSKRVSIVGGPPLNWDTLGQLDIVTANGAGALASTLASAHDRPVAVIFSAGPLLDGQDRSPSATDDVTVCGGNYDAKNYLDPDNAGTTGGYSNFLGGTNNASGSTGDSDQTNDPDIPKGLLPFGRLFAKAGLLRAGECTEAGCTERSNDRGQILTSNAIFDRVRDLPAFRADINTLLGQLNSCLRDQIASSTPTGQASRVPLIAGCFDDETPPKGYYSHYKDQFFLATAASGTYTVNGQACAGALIFSGTRAATQARITDTQRNGAGFHLAYLEGINATSFGSAATFSGPETLEKVSATQAASRDIVQCIASGPSLSSVLSTALTSSVQTAARASSAQLTSYNPAAQALTLGATNSSNYARNVSADLYGCAWQSDASEFSAGVRAYFQLSINDSNTSAGNPAEGFVFALADADNNGIGSCGAARQHLGYSGNNGDTPPIVAPKIGIEIDPSVSYQAGSVGQPTGFDPDYLFARNSDKPYSTLANGRADPSYFGHAALVYWGGEQPIGTTRACALTGYGSMFCPVGASTWQLPAEDDDNVHGREGSWGQRTGFALAPGNPTPPATTRPGYGAISLDARRLPTNQALHVRVEVTRAPPKLAAVRLASSAAVTLPMAGAGATLDGVALAEGDRVLLKHQADRSENGIYTWTPSAGLTLASDGFGGAITNAIVTAAAGTQAGLWRQIPDSQIPDEKLSWVPLEGLGASTATGLLTVRAATTENLSLSAPGAGIDGIALANGDRILLKNQDNPAANGIYVWNGDSTALTRADDANSSSELAGAVVYVRQGSTQARSLWRQSSTSFTLDSGAQHWANARVKVAVPAAASLSGTSIGGVMMAPGDRVLVIGSGIYIWNAANSLTPAADVLAAGAGVAVFVAQGSDSAGTANYAGSWWQLAGSNWSRVTTVRTASQAAIDLAAAPATIGGVKLTLDDAVLIRTQAHAADNDVYLWKGAEAAMVRATPAAGAAGALVQVLEGIDAGRTFRQTAAVTSSTPGAEPRQWDAIDGSGRFRVETWIDTDASNTVKHAAMADTTRPLAQLYPAAAIADLRDQPIIGYPFRNARLGFTIGQSRNTTDQNFTVTKFTRTWLQ